MMDCNKAQELMSLALDDMLTDTEKQALELHMQQCETCREAYDLYLSIHHELQSVATVEVPSGFHEELMDKLKEDIKQVHKHKRFNYRSFNVAAVIVFVIIFGVISIDYLEDFRSDIELSDSAVSIHRGEVEKKSEVVESKMEAVEMAPNMATSTEDEPVDNVISITFDDSASETETATEYPSSSATESGERVYDENLATGSSEIIYNEENSAIDSSEMVSGGEESATDSGESVYDDEASVPDSNEIIDGNDYVVTEEMIEPDTDEDNLIVPKMEKAEEKSLVHYTLGTKEEEQSVEVDTTEKNYLPLFIGISCLVLVGIVGFIKFKKS